jgi:hypothetical protein
MEQRNIFRKAWTRGNCGPQHELAAVRKLIHRAGVARRIGNFVRKH